MRKLKMQMSHHALARGSDQVGIMRKDAKQRVTGQPASSGHFQSGAIPRNDAFARREWHHSLT